jgi:hypothetical protein
MLRQAVLAAAGLFIVGGLALCALTGAGAGWGAIAFGVILLVGTLFERVHYKPIEHQHPGPGWQRTSERFFDEEIGKPVSVYIHPDTGERRYVED